MDIFNLKYNYLISNNKPIPFINDDAIEFKKLFLEGYKTKWLFIVILTIFILLPNLLFTKNLKFIFLFLTLYIILFVFLYYLFIRYNYKIFLCNIYEPIILYNDQFGVILSNAFKNDVLKFYDSTTKKIILDIITKIDRMK